MDAIEETGSQTRAVAAQKSLTVAVAGNPNAGKSTLVNAIAGSRLNVGNWPGVTVEKKEATFCYQGANIRLVDLPGAYSLSPYTQEEVIARDYLVQENPDVIINVVDSTNLERNFYLTIQLLELGMPVVIVLNFYDEAEKKGYKLKVGVIEEMFGVKVIPTIATKKTGIGDLLKTVSEVAENRARYSPKEISYGPDIESAINQSQIYVRENHRDLVNKYPLRWLAIKLIEGDINIVNKIDIDRHSFDALVEGTLHHLIEAHGEDIEAVMADARYGLAAGITREALIKPEIRKIELTEKIDKIALHRFFGIPIFLFAMWIMFKLTFDIAIPFVDWIDAMSVGPFKRWAIAILDAIGTPQWTVSLVTDGIIAGVGFVLVFVPVIFTMMFFITFLEASGYMARAAFIMDKAMHAIGLHGKSFIPMLLGFGCNVPAIYATRTLENPRDKALTALLIPLMSCGARLPVYVLFASTFFAARSSTVIWSLYVLGIALAILTGFIFKKTLFKGESPMFIMELPPYRMPSFKNLTIHTWEKGKHFLVKAGTYILAVSILVWFILNLPWGVESKKDSLLGRAGQLVSPVLRPVGFGNWEAASALLTGVIAKEIVIGTMGEIYAVEVEADDEVKPTLTEDLEEIGLSFVNASKSAATNIFSTFGIAGLSTKEDTNDKGLRPVVKRAFTPLGAYAFMVFVLLYMPCVVVAIAMRNEFGTWKWFGIAFVYQMTLAWMVAFIIYQGGRLLGLGS